MHRLHPLAGQGFNMIVRDIEVVVDLIKFKKEHGLDLDNSIFNIPEIEKKITAIKLNRIDMLKIK